MATSKQFLDFILDQLSGVGGVTYKPMMGEYILYCRGLIVGGLYDNRLLIKPTAAARRLMPNAPEETPYEGAKPMLAADADDRALLAALLPAVAAELETGKAGKPKG